MAGLRKEIKALIPTVIANLIVALFLLSAPALAAENQGMFEIQIKDHREAIGDFAKLDIIIDKNLISPKPGLKFWQTGWKELTPSISNVDLTKYIGKSAARIFRGAIAAGAFEGFQLKIKNIDARLKKYPRSPSVRNIIGPIKLDFEVPAKGETLLVFDLVVTVFSDHPPRGYELSISGYEIYTNGKLVDKIPPG